MAITKLQRGTTTSVTVDGSYTRGNGGWNGQSSGSGDITSLEWAVDDKFGNMIAFAEDFSGWNVNYEGSPGDTPTITITVPANQVFGVDFAAYIRKPVVGNTTEYFYKVFDVVSSAGSRRRGSGSQVI